MKIFLLTLCWGLCLGLSAQTLSLEQAQDIKSTILSLHAQEQAAFKAGNCDEVKDFFHPQVQFFASGRKAPSREFIGKFCQQVPRPFQEGGIITDEVHVLSPDVAYLLRTIDLPARESEPKMREVITKVWQLTEEGWKIVHFHSSVSPVKHSAQAQK